MLAKLAKKNQCIFVCKKCDYETYYKPNYERHCLTAKHRLIANIANNEPRKFYCEYCDYSTSRKNDYNKLCLTAKHNKVAKLAKGGTENDEKILQSKEYVKRIEDLETKTAHIISQNKVQT